MVIVQFRGRLVRQYRACVIDSLGLGITCLYYYYYYYHFTAQIRDLPSERSNEEWIRRRLH